MANRPASQTEWMNWAWFAAGLIFAAGVAAAALQDWPVRSWMIVLVGLLLTALRYRSLALVLDVFFIDWLGKMPFGSNPGAVYDHGYCRSSSYGVRSISADASTGCASERGVVCDNGGNPQRLFSIRLDRTGLCGSVARFVRHRLARPPCVVVNSASGNTMHLTQSFIEGVRRTGAAVTVHRFHYFRKFHAELAGMMSDRSTRRCSGWITAAGEGRVREGRK
jgi:hypothetical protein